MAMIDGKKKGILDVEWEEIVDTFDLDMNAISLRKANDTPFGGWFVKEFLERKNLNNTPESIDQNHADKILEIKKETQKLRDERTSLNKSIREFAREEYLIETFKNTIMNHIPCHFKYVPNNVKASGNDMIVHLTDVHCGIEINSSFNTFNNNILKSRLFKFLDEIIEVQEMHESENCYLILGGDLISGLIHVNMRIENKDNIIDQIMCVSELISNFTYELSKHFNKVTVALSSGNHGRAIPNKNEAVKGENFDKLIPFYMKASLKDIRNIYIIDNTLDEAIATFDVRGHMVYAIHGEKDSPKNVAYNMYKLARKAGVRPPDLIYLGHRHTNGLTTTDGDIKVIESGCVDGMDNFAVDGRFVGNPEQTISIITEKSKLKCLYDIQLD